MFDVVPCHYCGKMKTCGAPCEYCNDKGVGKVPEDKEGEPKQGNFEVASTDGESTYLVQLHRVPAPWASKESWTDIEFCSCPAYRYSGDFGRQSCKHIAEVRRWQLQPEQHPKVRFLTGPSKPSLV